MSKNCAERIMKTILTVIGKDQTGIIAGISQQLYELDINILDVSQTIMDEYFTMIMLLDLSKIKVSFDEVKTALIQTGNKLKVKINLQREEIFDAMHRL
jgi:ACT domain-containing protein